MPKPLLIKVKRNTLLEIHLVTEQDEKRWNDYLSQFDIPPLSTFAWKHILEKSYSLKTLFFMATDNEEICGILPTYLVKNIRGQEHLYSLKFGLVANTDEIHEQLLLHLKEFCNQNNIISTPITAGYIPVNTTYQKIVKKTVVLDLTGNEEQIWSSFSRSARNKIRKARKSNLVAERGFHNLKQFYEIYTDNWIRKGLSINSYKFFEILCAHLPQQTELIVAKKDDQVIAGMLLLLGKNVATYPCEASTKEALRYASNQFLIWEAVKICLNKKIFKLDMGESTEGGSVYEFKTKLGGKPQDIFYYNFPQHENISLPPKESHEKLRFSIPKPSFAYVNKHIMGHAPYTIKKQWGLWLKTKGKVI